ncbi:MAG: hypothetical protein UT11_C0010G0021 [Berkelbacteria bacterium GW2011_GWA2_38_9]|uniref:Uncharacterized protein n=1 Tax=Berkelbacteria bacterium GW2011_GWA2_38_9 TaxID=1618334 RepID=A0A0G0NWM2_9BACT|nr:MAG: hypothetical protein UT11_C0010G0021 [Berkelbacteria bacterium GW2011_GWA2_38_9]
MKIVRSLKTMFILGLLLIPAVALADVGPKPGMSFNIEGFNSIKATIIGAEQIECKDVNCSDSSILAKIGPQTFNCVQEDLKCYSLAYDYSDYHKVKIKFSDGVTKESNIFQTLGFDSKYNLRVLEDRLYVYDASDMAIFDDQPATDYDYNPMFGNQAKSKLGIFYGALFLTLVIELLTGLIFLKTKKKPLIILIYLALANFISLPTLWFLFPLLPISSHNLIILLGELFVVIFEILFLYLFCRKHLTIKEIIILIIIANLLSYWLGIQVWTPIVN